MWSSPYSCIARPCELWFERLDFDVFSPIWSSVIPGTVVGRRIVSQFSHLARMHSSKMTGSTRGMTMSKGQRGRRLLGVAVIGAVLSYGGTALAELGQPAPWEFKLQEAA